MQSPVEVTTYNHGQFNAIQGILERHAPSQRLEGASATEPTLEHIAGDRSLLNRNIWFSYISI